MTSKARRQLWQHTLDQSSSQEASEKTSAWPAADIGVLQCSLHVCLRNECFRLI